MIQKIFFCGEKSINHKEECKTSDKFVKITLYITHQQKNLNLITFYMLQAKTINKSQLCFCKGELKNRFEKNTKEKCITVKERTRLFKLVMLAVKNNKSKKDKKILKKE